MQQDLDYLDIRLLFGIRTILEYLKLNWKWNKIHNRMR